MLRKLPRLLHLRAEINPLFALAGLHDGRDRRRVLEAELLRDIGRPAPPGALGEEERRRMVVDLSWRLTLQWPHLVNTVDLDELLSLVDQAVPSDGSHHDAVGVQLSVLAAQRRRGALVDPRYYDLPAPAAARFLEEDRGAGAAPAVGPPGEAVVEMPPFVTLDRWEQPSAEQLREWPLVVTTPRCAFRLEFMRDLFPGAELRVVHLTRNPGASVNGLVDGWRHHGFFNCPVPEGLAIDGYSDVVPGGDRWWCYDFPPGWEAWTAAPLEDVCAYQWWATHVAAIEACDRMGVSPLRLRFEDVVGPREARTKVSAALAPLLGVPETRLRHVLAADLPVVMATAEPAPARWRSRGEALREVLREATQLELAASLGYARSGAGWV